MLLYKPRFTMKNIAKFVACVCLSSISAGLVARSECGAIEGHVFLGPSRPLSDVSISAASRLASLYFDAITDANGRYILDKVPPGNYTMFADAKQFGCILIPHVIVMEGQHVQQDFRFQLSGTSKGCENTKGPLGMAP
jgi:carboxypeptidase family protein